MEITAEERLLLSLQGEMQRQEIQQRLGLKDSEHLRLYYLLPALAAGLIEMTLPDKPNSRLQKYRLTTKGKIRLSYLLKKGLA